MNRRESKYDLSWMPIALDAISHISIHANSILEKAETLSVILNKHKELSSQLQEKDNELKRVRIEIPRLERIAEHASDKYNTFSTQITPKAMDAKRRGDPVDTEGMSQLIELDLDQKIAYENIDNALNRIKAIIEEKGILQSTAFRSIAGSNELSEFNAVYKTASEHFSHLASLLLTLDIDIFDGQLHEDFSERGYSNAAKKYLDLMESRELIDVAKRCIAENFNVNTIIEILESLRCLLTTAPIDSSQLFSEICIFLAQRKYPESLSLPAHQTLCFPEQPPTLENLTPF